MQCGGSTGGVPAVGLESRTSKGGQGRGTRGHTPLRWARVHAPASPRPMECTSDRVFVVAVRVWWRLRQHLTMAGNPRVFLDMCGDSAWDGWGGNARAHGAPPPRALGTLGCPPRQRAKDVTCTARARRHPPRVGGGLPGLACASGTRAGGYRLAQCWVLPAPHRAHPGSASLACRAVHAVCCTVQFGVFELCDLGTHARAAPSVAERLAVSRSRCVFAPP